MIVSAADEMGSLGMTYLLNALPVMTSTHAICVMCGTILPRTETNIDGISTRDILQLKSIQIHWAFENIEIKALRHQNVPTYKNIMNIGYLNVLL